MLGKGSKFFAFEKWNSACHVDKCRKKCFAHELVMILIVIAHNISMKYMCEVLHVFYSFIL